MGISSSVIKHFLWDPAWRKVVQVVEVEQVHVFGTERSVKKLVKIPDASVSSSQWMNQCLAGVAHWAAVHYDSGIGFMVRVRTEKQESVADLRPNGASKCMTVV